MRDLWSTEITRSLEPFGNVYKHPDLGFRRKSGNDQLPGFPDLHFIGGWGVRSCYLEVKTAEGKNHTTFFFNQWRENQRDYYQRFLKPKGIPLWLPIFFGVRIGNPEFPRTLLVLDAEQVLKLEQEFERKSIPLTWALVRSHLCWTWAKNGRWDIPQTHMFYTDMRIWEARHEQSA